MKNLVLFAVFVSLLAYACKKEEVAKVDLSKYDCATTVATYDKDIKPILDKSCSFDGCHSSKNPSDGVDLSNYGQAKIHAGHDHFMGSLEQLSGYEAMPKGGVKLSEAQIKLFACWIKGGLKEK
jgi:hypothetical protein